LSEKFHIVLSKNGAFSLNNTSKSYQQIDFSNYPDEDILWNDVTIKSTIHKILHHFDLPIFGIAYPALLMISLMFFSLKLIFFALIGFVYGKLSGIKLSIAGMLRVIVFSSIPSILIHLLLSLYLFATNASLIEFYGTANRPLVTNLALVIFIGYFFAALDSIRVTKKHLKN
jgi:hypothetical protein